MSYCDKRGDKQRGCVDTAVSAVAASGEECHVLSCSLPPIQASYGEPTPATLPINQGPLFPAVATAIANATGGPSPAAAGGQPLTSMTSDGAAGSGAAATRAGLGSAPRPLFVCIVDCILNALKSGQRSLIGAGRGAGGGGRRGGRGERGCASGHLALSLHCVHRGLHPECAPVGATLTHRRRLGGVQKGRMRGGGGNELCNWSAPCGVSWVASTLDLPLHTHPMPLPPMLLLLQPAAPRQLT